jgi:hypothetical protein
MEVSCGNVSPPPELPLSQRFDANQFPFAERIGYCSTKHLSVEKLRGSGSLLGI